MTADTTLTRCRRFAVQLIALLYFVVLGLGVWVLYPYSAGATSDAIPWKWNPPRVCYTLWFLQSAVWLTLAFVLSIPFAVHFFRPVRQTWIVILASAGLVVLS